MSRHRACEALKPSVVPLTELQPRQVSTLTATATLDVPLLVESSSVGGCFLLVGLAITGWRTVLQRHSTEDGEEWKCREARVKLGER